MIDVNVFVAIPISPVIVVPIAPPEILAEARTAKLWADLRFGALVTVNTADPILSVPGSVAVIVIGPPEVIPPWP